MYYMCLYVVICVELPVNANPTRRYITNAMFVSGKLKRRANREVLGMDTLRNGRDIRIYCRKLGVIFHGHPGHACVRDLRCGKERSGNYSDEV